MAAQGQAALKRAADYRPTPHAYDEFMTASGQVRPHWRDYLATLDTLGPGDLAHRWSLVDRLLRENGLAYDLPGQDDVAGRPLALDLIPFVMAPGEWRALEKGLVQRARLLNAVLLDLYGPRRCLSDGVLPAAIVAGDARYLRPCVGIVPRDGVFLQFLAVDLGRTPDGQWRVMADRAELTTEIGYALENRIVLSHALPEFFAACRVQRWARHFQDVREALVARSRRENPRIVHLSPGPGDRTYFADAYLTRYLGFTLAEGADMTLRGGRVNLKTIDGLKPVDLIVRRIDGADSDPLELKPDSLVGVPGLLHGLRDDSVALANAPGSALVDSPSFMAFYQGLCRRLLDEELALPSVATWWCGEAEARAFALAEAPRLVFRTTSGAPVLGAGGPSALCGHDLGSEELAGLKRRMELRADDIVAQEIVMPSTTPTWRDGRLVPGSMWLRVFVAATGEGYSVMPGGFVRVAQGADIALGPAGPAERSKDVWVPGDAKAVAFASQVPGRRGVALRRTGRDLPSRAADNLYWLGRYAERAEGLMRLLLTGYRRLAGDPGTVDELETIAQLVVSMLWRDQPEQGPGTTPMDELEAAVLKMLTDPTNGLGLPATLGHVMRTARLARDRLSLEAWYTLNHFGVDPAWRGILSGAAPKVPAGEMLDLLEDGLRTFSAFSGLEMENMTRNQGWRFLDMGRRLERAGRAVQLIRRVLAIGEPGTTGGLVLLLELADSLMTYRSRYLTTPLLGPVLDLLVIDETNPRSVGFQIRALADHIAALPRDADVPVLGRDQKLILGLQSRLRLADVEALARRPKRGRPSRLDALLGAIEAKLPELSAAIIAIYFSHLEARRPPEFFGSATPQ